MTDAAIIILTVVIFAGFITIMTGLLQKREALTGIGGVVMLSGLALEQWTMRYKTWPIIAACLGFVILIYIARRAGLIKPPLKR